MAGMGGGWLGWDGDGRYVMGMAGGGCLVRDGDGW